MDDNKELLQALNGIQAELQRINKTLADMATQKARSSASASARPAARTEREEGGFGRPERKGPSEYGGSDTKPRFGKSKPGGPRAKGKPLKKKGEGYPKKAR